MLNILQHIDVNKKMAAEQNALSFFVEEKLSLIRIDSEYMI